MSLFSAPSAGCGVLLVVLAALAADASAASPELRLEYAPARVSLNNLQRPNDARGDRFSVIPLTERDVGLVRGEIRWRSSWWNEDAEWRLAYVPFRQQGTGVPSQPFRYDGVAFAATAPVQGRYQFDTYRLSYSVPVGPAVGHYRLGGTLAIRDAKTRFGQAGQVATFNNVGPVPLAYANARWALSARWTLGVEAEGFPAPGGGGLFDSAVSIHYRLNRHASIELGGRYLAGGAQDREFHNNLVAYGGFVALTLR